MPDWTPKLEDLEVLILWPPGSVGEEKEKSLVRTLLELCQEHGIGRVSQLASQMEEIWRHPQSKQSFADFKAEHLQWMEQSARDLADET